MVDERTAGMVIWIACLSTFVALVVFIWLGHHEGGKRIQAARIVCIEQGGQWIEFNVESRICIRGDHNLGDLE